MNHTESEGLCHCHDVLCFLLGSRWTFPINFRFFFLIFTKHATKNPLVKSSGRQRTSEVALQGSAKCSLSPRRCQVGSTSFWGAKINLPTLASSESNAACITCSFSMACRLHVEYTILVTLGNDIACFSIIVWNAANLCRRSSAWPCSTGSAGIIVRPSEILGIKNEDGHPFRAGDPAD